MHLKIPALEYDHLQPTVHYVVSYIYNIL